MIQLACIALLFVIGTAPSAFSQTFTVGVEDIDYMPLYAVKKGAYQGYTKDVMTKFAQSKGYEFKFEPFPVIRLTKYFIQGKVDFKFPDHENWAGDAKQGKEVVYSDAVIGYTDGVMVLPKNKGKGIANMKKLGMVRGFTPWDFLSLIKSGSVSQIEASSLKAVIKQTIHSRVDGAYFNVSVANHFLTNNLKTPGALVFDNSLPHTQSSYKLSSIKYPKIIKEFNQFLLDEAAWIAKTKKKYQLD